MFRSLGYLAILVLGIVIALMRLKNRGADDLQVDDSLPKDHWRCPLCEEAVPCNFVKCWNCGGLHKQDRNN